jgi:hypothetical protein
MLYHDDDRNWDEGLRVAGVSHIIEIIVPNLTPVQQLV